MTCENVRCLVRNSVTEIGRVFCVDISKTNIVFVDTIFKRGSHKCQQQTLMTSQFLHGDHLELGVKVNALFPIRSENTTHSFTLKSNRPQILSLCSNKSQKMSTRDDETLSTREHYVIIILRERCRRASMKHRGYGTPMRIHRSHDHYSV